MERPASSLRITWSSSNHGPQQRHAERSVVSMTTAESSGVGHLSLPLRNAGWPALLLPVNASVSVNFGVTHPRDHLR